MSLTTTASLKALLNVRPDDASQDGWLDALRIAAEARVKAYLKRDVESQTYTEFYSGNGTQKLPLRMRPVTAVLNVWANDEGFFGQGLDTVAPFGPLDLLVAGEDYALELDQLGSVSQSGLLLRMHRVWPERLRPYMPGRLYPETGEAYGNIKVQYTAGFSPVPQEVQMAVALLASAMRRDMPLGGPARSERLGEYSYEIMGARELWAYGGGNYPLPHSVEGLLAPYRELPW